MTATPETSKTPAAPTRLKPIVTLEIKFFWDAADREELMGEKCGDCGKFRFPPRPMCPYCNSLKKQHVKLSGRGKVYSWIQPRHPMPAGFTEPPIVALIELEEGFRFVSNLYDIALADVTRDLPVEVFFVPTMGNRKLPVFRPRGKP